MCPHQGGAVAEIDGCFECPQHGWRFDLRTGQCLSGPAAELAHVPVTVKEGHLYAEMAPSRAPQTSRRPPVEFPHDLRIRLAGHASLEIQHAGFTLLTDPWLTGAAFLGAWVTYPESQIDPATLRPDAIWISHEHSDHFHKASLAAFDRRTPIYCPDFPNQRLPRELREMGFAKVQTMRFGQAYDVGPRLRLTCYEPPGLWNDSIVLIELDGIRILNINDAGVNHRIASIVGPVDILTSAFAPASSYPLAWSHLPVGVKSEIAERSRLGMLRMLHQAVKRYSPRYLVPFASHFTLWHPSHREYARLFRKNTLDDVLRAFRSSPVPVIDMLPGGSWEPATGRIDHGGDRTGLYDWPRVESWLDRTFDQSVFNHYHPPAGALARDEVDEYFLRLNAVPDVDFCEDLTVTIEGMEAGRVALETSIAVASGQVSILRKRPSTANLTMQVPLNVLRHLIQTGASWDEAHVGFWCTFSRTPDVFSAGFWRLLQAPYFMRGISPPTGDRSAEIAAHANVAELIERYGGQADRILGRYGLHCAGCPHSAAESVALAAQRHGVDAAHTARLLRELNAVLGAGEVASSL